jgi:hypothetical protein
VAENGRVQSTQWIEAALHGVGDLPILAILDEKKMRREKMG